MKSQKNKDKPREIKEAKRNLFHKLLTLPHETLTDNEVEIMYRLCCDDDIQDILRKAILNEK